jgi:phosphoglycerate dehydrogenase-like enzyme
MKVCVLDDYQNVARRCADWSSLGPDTTVDFCTRPITAAEAPATLRPYQVIIVMRERMAFPASLIAQLPELRLLVTTGPRNRSIDLSACGEHGITVCGTRSDGELAAELAWALIMALYKGVPGNDADVRSGFWQTNLGHSLRGSTLGLIGLGKLGQRMARFGQAFGMRVMAWSPNLTPERCEPLGVEHVSKDTLFQQADVVSLHMVLSDATRHLVAAPDLARMKKTAYLVNTSRGGLVDENALCDALHRGVIAGAALDVFEREPLPTEAEILRTPNVLLSPHMGYVTWQNYQTYFTDAVENIQRWRTGDPLRVLTA